MCCRNRSSQDFDSARFPWLKTGVSASIFPTFGVDSIKKTREISLPLRTVHFLNPLAFRTRGSIAGARSALMGRKGVLAGASERVRYRLL